MLVSVTRKHIKNGNPISPSSCPIALALRETCETEQTIRVYNQVEIGGREYYLPRSVLRFINRFDNEKSVKPFRFKFDYEG